MKKENNTEHTRQIMLDAVKNHKGRHIEEIKEVKSLGEKIGYGNIMDICSILWALHFQKQGKRTIPRIVVSPRANEEDCETAEDLIKIRMLDYKSFGF